MMKFQIHIEEEDYIKFNIYHAFHSDQAKKTLLLGRMLCFIFSAFAILIMVLSDAGHTQILAEIVVLTVISIVWYIYYPTHARKRIRKQILIMKKEGKLPYHAEETIEFGDTEILETAASEINKTSYSEIIAVYETEDALYLKKGAVNYILIPYRCLEGRTTEVVEFIKTRAKNLGID